jgi:sn-glycerol 3-phosphate transport system substrate-binding protein
MKTGWRLALACAVAWAAASAQAAVELQFWHSMTGVLADQVTTIAEKFNRSQGEFRVLPVYKGDYDQGIAAGIAAFRAGNAPHILQVYEVGTASMMAAKGAVKPVYELMTEAGEPFDPGAFLPPVASYYTDAKGKMLSLPFNASTVVLYYNKDAFRRANLDPKRAPRTWQELEAAAAKLKAAGVSCPYTSAWQSWVHLENFSARHNLPFATRANGFDGADARFVFNGPVQLRHLAKLSEWQKKGYYAHSSRKREAQERFFDGSCAMLTSSSAAHGNVVKLAKFEFGVAPLPYHADVSGAPKNTIIGGASLWVFAGKSRDENRGVAKFFRFVTQPEIQAEWHRTTGYLPITKAAYQLARKQGLYESQPGLDVAVQEMMGKTPAVHARGLRVGNFVQIRAVFDEEMDAVWSGRKTPRQALDSAKARGDVLLKEFEQAHHP